MPIILISVTECLHAASVPLNLGAYITDCCPHGEEDEPTVKDEYSKEENTMTRCKDGVKECKDLSSRYLVLYCLSSTIPYLVHSRKYSLCVQDIGHPGDGHAHA